MGFPDSRRLWLRWFGVWLLAPAVLVLSSCSEAAPHVSRRATVPPTVLAAVGTAAKRERTWHVVGAWPHGLTVRDPHTGRSVELRAKPEPSTLVLTASLFHAQDEAHVEAARKDLRSVYDRLAVAVLELPPWEETTASEHLPTTGKSESWFVFLAWCLGSMLVITTLVFTLAFRTRNRRPSPGL